MATDLVHTLPHRWSHLSVRQRGTVIIAIPVVCLITTLATSIWVQRHTSGARAEVERAETVLQQTTMLTKYIVDAETSVRGYDITRNPTYLQPYQVAVSRLPSFFTQLNQLVVDPRQQQRLQTIQQLTEQKMQVLQTNLDTVNRQEQPLLPSPELNTLLNQGKTLMDTLRQETNSFWVVEDRRLDQRKAHLARQETIALVILSLTVLVGIIGALLAKYLFDNLDQELAERREHLKESTTRLQAIVDNVADGIITFQANGTIESFNPAAQEIFGYSELAIIGQNIQRLLSDLSQDTQDFLAQLTAAQAGQAQEMTGHRSSGEPFLVEMAVSQIQLNRQTLLVGVLRDVTQQRQTAEQLRLYAEEQAHASRALAQTARILRRRNQELDQFAYVVSHDLKAPLRAIANLSEWLEEDLQDKLTPDTRRQMDMLRGRVHRMEALITGLLQYSRVGRLDGQPQTVAVASLLQEVLDSLVPDPDFIVEVPSRLPVLVTERLPLQQVFSNLLSNALKHHDRQPGDPPGHIWITAQARENCYEFAVADDGPGIDPRYHDKVFDIFQTLEARDNSENTGIGLSLVKKIVDSQGGKVWIESSHRGTTFRFQWPTHLHSQRTTQPWTSD